ncbi:IS30 family transposase [Phyllobacterium endophyticum]|nr:IS30 family transposase [Phyllobacterium endophyticum]
MPRTFTQLTMGERRIVAQMLQGKACLAQVAVALGGHRSTIHRGIKRNWWHGSNLICDRRFDGRLRNASGNVRLRRRAQR